MKCKKRKEGEPQNSDSDSFEEDDDICVEDAKPKNPFMFKQEIVKGPAPTKTPVLVNKDRYKFYGNNLPAHAKTKVKTEDN